MNSQDHAKMKLLEERNAFLEAQNAALIKDLNWIDGQVSSMEEEIRSSMEQVQKTMDTLEALLKEKESQITALKAMQTDSKKVLNEFRQIVLELDGSHFHATDCLSEQGALIADEELPDCDCNTDVELGQKLAALLTKTNPQ